MEKMILSRKEVKAQRMSERLSRWLCVTTKIFMPNEARTPPRIALPISLELFDIINSAHPIKLNTIHLL